VRHELFPVGTHRIAGRRRHDLEILGAVGIGEYEEDIAAFFQIVLKAGLARCHQLRLRQRIGGQEQAVFGWSRDRDEIMIQSFAAGAADIHEEAWIGLPHRSAGREPGMVPSAW
jgi:hypothetical protein